MCVLFHPTEGGDVVKIAQLASIAGNQTRVSQPETPVTLQFQGNKFTLSPSQLRQLTAGQPLQLQGTLGKVQPAYILLLFSSVVFPAGLVSVCCLCLEILTYQALRSSESFITCGRTTRRQNIVGHVDTTFVR